MKKNVGMVFSVLLAFSIGMLPVSIRAQSEGAGAGQICIKKFTPGLAKLKADNRRDKAEASRERAEYQQQNSDGRFNAAISGYDRVLKGHDIQMQELQDLESQQGASICFHCSELRQKIQESQKEAQKMRELAAERRKEGAELQAQAAAARQSGDPGAYAMIQYIKEHLSLLKNYIDQYKEIIDEHKRYIDIYKNHIKRPCSPKVAVNPCQELLNQQGQFRAGYETYQKAAKELQELQNHTLRVALDKVVAERNALGTPDSGLSESVLWHKADSELSAKDIKIRDLVKERTRLWSEWSPRFLSDWQRVHGELKENADANSQFLVLQQKIEECQKP